jgi:membrane carboxypeptidase/penicillin-binding protein
MQDNNARTMEFGPSSKLVIPKQIVSVKTGTTNDLKDNWTVGFTPDFLTITWVGNNDDTPMNQALVSGITGAAPIWNDIMSYILKDKQPHWQDKPDDVLSAQVCVSGFPPVATASAGVADPACQPKDQELYWSKSGPSASKYEQKNIWIHNDTGIPFKTGDSTDNLSLQLKTILSDPVTGEYCSDCTQPLDENGKPTYSPGSIVDDSHNPADSPAPQQ